MPVGGHAEGRFPREEVTKYRREAGLARARKKADKTGVEVVFESGIVEALPFPDSQFDAVLSIVMLHHLGREVRQQCAQEVRRVLKPGGRVLAVDFARPAEGQKGLLGRFHHYTTLVLS